MKHVTLLLLIGSMGHASGQAASVARWAEPIQVICAVGPEGAGNAEASAAWKQLATADASALVAILGAMNGANELALNWLRAAVDTIAARDSLAGNPLPLAALEEFLCDTRNHPQARRLAYELIAGANPATAERLIAGRINDPGRELRREAVQRNIDEAAAAQKAGRSNDATAKFQALLRAARDVDQIEGIAKNLKALGQPVELGKVFGWVTVWKVIGPFDNTGGAGFERVYPPEQRIDLSAEYDGTRGTVRWQDFEATGDYGRVDLNKPCGTLKEVTGYACAEVQSDRARPVEVRLGCKNGWKLWLNGRFLFGRDEYHRGAEIDQYRLAAELKPGRNVLLVKLCQNEQKEDWTKEWEFQLRITDSLGAPVVFAKQ